MRVMFFLLFVSPFIVNAQINRSATEFAKDNVSEYITTKLFKNNSYKPLLYGQLKEWKEKNSGIAWFIEHQFEITETEMNTGKKTSVQKPYRFTFYFNDRMKVVRAESYDHLNRE